MHLSTKYDEFIIETYIKEVDMLLLESKTTLRDKFLKLLKLVLRKGYKYRRKILVYGLASLITMASISEVSELFANDVELKELAYDANVTELVEKELEKIPTKDVTSVESGEEFSGVDEIPKKKEIPIDYSDRPWELQKNPKNMRLSQKGWDYIKYEEGSIKQKGKPVLTAYSIGDGMVTIGWGHAEKTKKSNIKVGDKITYDQAYEYLKQDLTVSANGVRRILKRFEDKGIDVKLSQDQFDVLVSLAYNSGVGALNRSSVIRHIKNGDLEKAGRKIENWRLKNRKKFPGLVKRRKLESEKFLSYKKFS